MRVDQIEMLEDAFEVVSEEMGEGLKFGNSSTNWSNTNATNHTVVALQLTVDEKLELGGKTPGKNQQIVIKKSDLSNVAPSQQSTHARFRGATFRVTEVFDQDALYVISLIDPSD